MHGGTCLLHDLFATTCTAPPVTLTVYPRWSLHQGATFGLAAMVCVVALQLRRRVPRGTMFLGEVNLQGDVLSDEIMRDGPLTAARVLHIHTIYMPTRRWEKDWAAVQAVGGVKMVGRVKLVPVDNIGELVGLLWPTEQRPAAAAGATAAGDVAGAQQGSAGADGGAE